MPLEPRDKELAAIGASIGANCRPCIEHHLMAGRAAGLSEAELADAVVTAHGLRREAVELLSARIDELLGHGGPPPEPAAVTQTSKARELVALGVGIGTNSHPLLHLHIGAAFDAGIEVHQIRSALKMAGHVQRHAAEITANEATRALTERTGARAERVAAE